MAEEGQTITTHEVKEEKNPIDSRLKDLLADKASLSEEVKKREQKIQELERENQFNSGFVDILSNHPAAKDHKDEIKSKVLSGYSPEDAAFAVLGKAGKLGTPTSAAPTPVVAGGSAINTPQTGEKTIKDMSQAERREKLAQEMGWS